MSIAETVDVLPAALWPQGDIRDPLGTWGFRKGITGDASGGGLKVTARAAAGIAAAYLYTCYSVNIAHLTGTPGTPAAKCRLLTNWPNVDVLAGVQAYATLLMQTTVGGTNFTPPIAGIQRAPLVQPNDRFLLLFDPRPSAGVMELVELEWGENTDGDTYSFEGYGYFWDRSVLNAPGGPRHPGAS